MRAGIGRRITKIVQVLRKLEFKHNLLQQTISDNRWTSAIQIQTTSLQYFKTEVTKLTSEVVLVCDLGLNVDSHTPVTVTWLVVLSVCH